MTTNQNWTYVRDGMIRAALEAVDKQGPKDRPVVLNVFFEFGKHRTVVYGTDGTVLFASWDDFKTEQTHDLVGRTFGIHWKDLGLALGDSDVRISMRPHPVDTHRIEMRYGQRMVSVPFDTNAPNWRGIVPGQINHEAAFHEPMSVMKLQKAFNVLRDLKTTNRSNPLPIMQNGTGPGVMYAPTETAIGLVMPFKLDADAVVDLKAGASEFAAKSVLNIDNVTVEEPTAIASENVAQDDEFDLAALEMGADLSDEEIREMLEGDENGLSPDDVALLERALELRAMAVETEADLASSSDDEPELDLGDALQDQDLTTAQDTVADEGEPTPELTEEPAEATAFEADSTEPATEELETETETADPEGETADPQDDTVNPASDPVDPESDSAEDAPAFRSKRNRRNRAAADEAEAA